MRKNTFRIDRTSAFAIAAVLASALTTGCVLDPLEGSDEPPTDEAEPALGEVTSSLTGSSPVSWVAIDFFTGADDKRSDSRVWARITLNNGNSTSQEILPGATWPNWTNTGRQWVQAPAGTRNQDIRDISIEWQQGGGGWNGDNWNLQSLSIYAYDPSYGYAFKGAPGGNPLRRFTGQVVQYEWAWLE